MERDCSWLAVGAACSDAETGQASHAASYSVS
jgi:hypothetical protein